MILIYVMIKKHAITFEEDFFTYIPTVYTYIFQLFKIIYLLCIFKIFFK